MRRKERTWKQRRRNAVNKVREIRKTFDIPAITANRAAAFFEDEKPEEFAEYERQINRALWQYMDIVNAPGFRALELPKPSGCGSLILHKSTRDGVDYQLSYIDASGVPVMHEDYNADGSGWRSMAWLYDELARQSFYGAATVTALYYQ